MTSEAGTTDPTNGVVSYRQLLRIEGFPQLAAATLLARTRGQLWEVALVLVVLQRFQSPALAGFAAFLAVAPGLVASPLMGALLDRYGCLRLIQLDLGIAATALALLAALAAADMLTPALLLLIVTLSSLTNPLTVCGTRALYPLVTPRARSGIVRTASITAAWRSPRSSAQRSLASPSPGSATRGFLACSRLLCTCWRGAAGCAGASAGGARVGAAGARGVDCIALCPARSNTAGYHPHAWHREYSVGYPNRRAPP
jgi:nitrate/nitrite transporter NarK